MKSKKEDIKVRKPTVKKITEKELDKPEPGKGIPDMDFKKLLGCG